MKLFIHKLWKDPVGSKLIATGLVAVLVMLGPWRGVWVQIKTALNAVGGALLYQVEIPIWLILILVPCVLLLIPFLQSFKSDNEESFVKYKSDEIFCINWSWDWSLSGYNNDKYSIKNLTARCPKCNSLLRLNSGHFEFVQCINDECNWQWHGNRNVNKRIEQEELEVKVLHVIDRKIKNNEYHNT